MLSCGVCALASEEKPKYSENDGYKIINNVAYQKGSKSYAAIDIFGTYESFKNTTKIVVIDKIDSLPVTSVTNIIYDYYESVGREKNTTVKQVVLPNSIRTIGDYTFYKLESLKKINMPKSLKYVGASAFSGDKNLKKLNLPDTVTYIGEWAFFRMESLEKFSFPKKIKNIPIGVLSSCHSLEKVTFKGNVKTIGAVSFADCKNLKSITIPKTVKEIGNEAFAHCKKLSKVVLKGYKLPKLNESVFCNTKKGIRFQVRTRAIAKQFKKQLKEKGTNKAKIYVGKKLIYKNITDDFWKKAK